ncbi:hypothetical protein DBT_1176 [Dissulfuribacter thermophilus]|uniref:Uncharacterized protein n=1 Tax=Dissulfuribacter thermophilus TaxID=1156395 RepID=A0A1B9F666_9BACT|nr:hypothetical protein DBT_1176 [Dissulfuribacter thermophilus]
MALHIPYFTPMAFYGWIAFLILIISEIALFKGIGFIKEFFYIFSWWSYIIILDAIIKKRRGISPITSNPKCFINLCIWSVTIWLIFELINLRLSNWHYINLTQSLWLRWVGYALSFATVLPGIFFTTIVLMDLLFKRSKSPHPVVLQRRAEEGERGLGWSSLSFEIASFFIGVLFLVLPLLWPQYFFPLVWGFSFFMLDPVNALFGGKSIISDFRRGERNITYCLLLGGLLCGFLWEFWNYWSGSKWIYTIPFVGETKLFEMPALGFLGFPPFALECFSMYVFVSTLGLGVRDPLNFDWSGCICRLAVPIVLSIPFWVVSFMLIDRYTVVSYGLHIP